MKCCICGTVRGCGKYLDRIFALMEQIGSAFEDYRIILYYDKSNDNTLTKLQDYSLKNDKMMFVENKDPLLKFRTHRIAKGRNKCLELFRTNYPDYDYFIMMDCDDKCNYNFKQELFKSFLSRNDWDALSFQHPVGYYDTWAFSKRPFVLSCHHFNDVSLGQKYISNIIRKTPKNKLIRCISAFNGFAIYRTNKFVNCWYDGRFRVDYFPKRFIKENKIFAGDIIVRSDELLHSDCEHRFFHWSAIRKNHARIMISPMCIFF